MKKILLMIPAYNEAENIGALLKQMKEAGLETSMDILVIDDCSRDGTSEIVKEFGFKVIRQVFNMGYGAALQTAYKYAVEKDYDYLLQMDADGQHDLCNVEVLCGKLGCFSEDMDTYPDIVIGSRFLEGSQSFHISRLKKYTILFFCKSLHNGKRCLMCILHIGTSEQLIKNYYEISDTSHLFCHLLQTLHFRIKMAITKHHIIRKVNGRIHTVLHAETHFLYR